MFPPKKSNSKISFPQQIIKNLSLLDQLNLFDHIMDNIGDELILLDSEGRIVYANKATLSGLGYSINELLKKHVFELFDKKITAKEWKATYLKDLKTKRYPIKYEISRVVKSGHVRTIEVTATYIKYKSEEYILSVGRDITDKLSIQQKQHDYEKTAALNHFVAGAIQEIKYPLEAVNQHLHKIISRYSKLDFEYIGFKDFKGLLHMLDNIKDEVSHCQDISDKMLIFSKQNLKMRVARSNANVIIQNLIRLLSQELEVSGIKVLMKLSRKMPAAAISQEDLSKCIRNIIENAIQAMPSGGRLSIKSTYYKKSNFILLDFKDDGIGIPKENLKHVFDPFFTTKTGKNFRL